MGAAIMGLPYGDDDRGKGHRIAMEEKPVLARAGVSSARR